MSKPLHPAQVDEILRQNRLLEALEKEVRALMTVIKYPPNSAWNSSESDHDTGGISSQNLEDTAEVIRVEMALENLGT